MWEVSARLGFSRETLLINSLKCLSDVLTIVVRNDACVTRHAGLVLAFPCAVHGTCRTSSCRLELCTTPGERVELDA